MAFSVFDKAIDLDVLYHPILNAIYYTVNIHYHICGAHVC